MKDLFIYGAGGYGHETACLVKKINAKTLTWNLLGFLDDNNSLWGKDIHYGKVMGGIDYLNNYKKEVDVIISIGSPNMVKKVYQSIVNSNVDFPNVFAPDFDCADIDNYILGKGNIFQKDCYISCNVTIGDFNTFNGHIGIGHDAMIGSFNSFMPAVRVSGAVTIGDNNFFGVGSIILQGIKIGNNVRLGAGSVLMTKTKDNNLYLGNPAKRIDL